MVKKLFKLLNKEFHGVNEAALMLGSFTFISQLLGLYRDRMLAHMIGPGSTLDVYYAAFRIPVVVYVLMPYLARHIAPGFDHEQINLLVNTSRLMLLSPIFIGLSNLIGTITQIFKNFLIFSLSPIFYNLGILSGIFFFYPYFGVYGLAIG